MSKMLIGILIVIAVSFFIIFVSSQNQSLQDELAGLEQSLSNSGYSWLVNYSVNYSEINLIWRNVKWMKKKKS